MSTTVTYSANSPIDFRNLRRGQVGIGAGLRAAEAEHDREPQLCHHILLSVTTDAEALARLCRLKAAELEDTQ